MLRRDFLLGFLTVLCACSLAMNAGLVLYAFYPATWREVWLSRLRPPETRANDHVRGTLDAAFTVIEYADFQCPFCQQMHETLSAATAEGRIRWVFRHDPLNSIHPLAVKEAEAAECAGNQGKFWEYADALFAAQRRVGLSNSPERELVSLAQEIGARADELEGCLESRLSAEKIKNAIREADALQISGTPTIFVNGVRHEGTMSYQDLSALTKSQAR